MLFRIKMYQNVLKYKNWNTYKYTSLVTNYYTILLNCSFWSLFSLWQLAILLQLERRDLAVNQYLPPSRSCSRDTSIPFWYRLKSYISKPDVISREVKVSPTCIFRTTPKYIFGWSMKSTWLPTNTSGCVTSRRSFLYMPTL